MSKISVVVVNYGTDHLLQGLLDSLHAQCCIDDVIIVHNSPSSFLPADTNLSIKQIQNPANQGFAKAVNKGINSAKHHWICVVNPDVRLMTDCVRQLLNAGEQQHAVLLGPRFHWDDAQTIRLPPATGMSATHQLVKTLSDASDLDAEIYNRQWIERHERFWLLREPFVETFISGALMLINVDEIPRCASGVMDESYFLYFEDNELCARATLAGKPPLCVPGAAAVHYWDQSPQPSQTKEQLLNNSLEIYLQNFRCNVEPLQLTAIGGHLKNRAAPLKRSSWPDFAAYPLDAWFEIGVNRHFVPFAQVRIADLNTGSLDQLLDNANATIWHFRVRNQFGQLLDCWQTDEN